MPKTIDVRIAPNGRLVLPRSARTALGVSGAGVLVLSIHGDEVRLTSMAQNIEQAQALYRKHVTHDLSVDDFLLERRTESNRDDAG